MIRAFLSCIVSTTVAEVLMVAEVLSKSQGISSHAIDRAWLEFSGFNTKRVKMCYRFWSSLVLVMACFQLVNQTTADLSLMAATMQKKKLNSYIFCQENPSENDDWDFLRNLIKGQQTHWWWVSFIKCCQITCNYTENKILSLYYKILNHSQITTDCEMFKLWIICNTIYFIR